MTVCHSKSSVCVAPFAHVVGVVRVAWVKGSRGLMFSLYDHIFVIINKIASSTVLMYLLGDFSADPTWVGGRY